MRTPENVARLIAAVTDMRRLQKAWFGGDKSIETLQASKKAERLVDKLLVETERPADPQGGLFT